MKIESNKNWTTCLRLNTGDGSPRVFLLNSHFLGSVPKKLVQFLSDKTISEIWIFGTSIGDVDIPYYRYINSKYPSANWYIAYFKDEDYTSISTIMEPLLGSNVDYLRTDEFLNKL